jgi:monoamine oxidase
MSDLFEPGGRWNGLLGAMVTYINGVEADRLVVAEYARYRDTDINRRLPQGYGALIEACARPLDIRLGCPATLIDHAGGRVRVTTPQGTLTARAAIVAVPPGVMANGTLRFSPALPDKMEAAHALPLGVADKMFLALDGGDDLPADTRLYGATDRVETGSYTLRPFARPVIDGYFGGTFARELEAQGDGAFTAFAIEQICAALGNDMRKRLTPIAESAWARDPWSLGAYSYGSSGAQAARAKLAAPVDGKLFFAGEHCSDVDFSTAHGAYRTGVQAAAGAINALKQQAPAD